jgi:hypothetical protein
MYGSHPAAKTRHPDARLSDPCGQPPSGDGSPKGSAHSRRAALRARLGGFRRRHSAPANQLFTARNIRRSARTGEAFQLDSVWTAATYSLFRPPSTSASSLMRRSISKILCPTSSSRRSIITIIASNTSSQCRARIKRCSPLGPYVPENQFFTVRSLAFGL